MKVVHLINTIAAGGAEKHLLTLTRLQKRQGLDVRVAYLREEVKGSRCLRDEFEREGIPAMRLRGEGRYALRGFLDAVRAVGREGPDVLHTHLPRADLSGAICSKVGPRKHWVCSAHAVYKRSWSARWALPLADRIWRRADSVIAISRAVRDWLVIERGIASTKVQVIHYGIESERFEAPGANPRCEWGLENRPIIGAIGRLDPVKGHDVLVRAMVDVVQRVPGAVLVIGGYDPGGNGKRIRALACQLGIENSVRLLGFQSDVPSFLRALDVFAFPSRSEGFGQAVVEAMAAGCPVVATRMAPLTEIIVERETGLFAEIDDHVGFAGAICELLGDRELARSMGRKGQERVRAAFTAERMARETLALYESRTSREG